MDRLLGIVRYMRKRIVGSLNFAVRMGMKVGSNIRVMSGVEFGSEPYLIELGNNITIAFNVRFITHDGGTWAFRDLPEYSDVFKYGKISVGDRTFVGGHYYFTGSYYWQTLCDRRRKRGHKKHP